MLPIVDQPELPHELYFFNWFSPISKVPETNMTLLFFFEMGDVGHALRDVCEFVGIWAWNPDIKCW